MLHNNATGRHATFSYIGNGKFTFKVIDASGNVVASGTGTEADVETRAHEWVHGALQRA